MRATIAIDPIPCPRPRVVVLGKHAHAYYPASYKAWKEEARDLIEEAFEARGLEGPLVFRVAVTVKKPKTSKLHAPAPDLDNYVKAVMDAITAAGIWVDDKQVEDLTASKQWGTAGSIDIEIDT